MVTEINPEKDGLISEEQFKKNIREDTFLVSVMLANNEIGVIQPLENISKLLGKKKSVTDVSIFSDGSSIYILTENDQMIDLLKKGQAVFGISLGPVHTETEAEILSLYPDKVSAANR